MAYSTIPQPPAYPIDDNGNPDFNNFTIDNHIQYAQENGVTIQELAQQWIDTITSQLEELAKNKTTKIMKTTKEQREQMMATLMEEYQKLGITREDLERMDEIPSESELDWMVQSQARGQFNPAEWAYYSTM